MVDGVKFSEHRVCWALHYGEWPSGVIDHINGDPTDNRICNLRDVDQSVNCQNRRKAHGNCSSGLIGAHKRTINGVVKYASSIMTRGKSRFLGLFNTPEEAHKAYVSAKRQLHSGCTI